MNRNDYAYPFRIDPASGQAAQASYPTHVDQMIRQVLLTSPGERADLPQFGCGLRQLIFAPNSDALNATTQIMVQQALNQAVGRSDYRSASHCRAPDQQAWKTRYPSRSITYLLKRNRTSRSPSL